MLALQCYLLLNTVVPGTVTENTWGKICCMKIYDLCMIALRWWAAQQIIRLNAWKHLLLIYLHEHTSDLFHLISFLPVIEVDKWLGMWKIRQIWPGFVFCNKVPGCVLAVKHAAVFKRNRGWAYCDFHLSFSESCELALGFYQSICKWRKWRHPSPSLNHMPGTSRWVSPSSTSHSFKIISKLRDGSRL